MKLYDIKRNDKSLVHGDIIHYFFKTRSGESERQLYDRLGNFLHRLTVRKKYVVEFSFMGQWGSINIKPDTQIAEEK